MGTDTYPYIATENIYAGTVLAYVPGDPVPEENALRLGYVDAGSVVPRAEYDPADPVAEGQPLKRGDMPPHLVSPESVTVLTPESAPATTVTVEPAKTATKSATKAST
jgi:hypothetical protein